MTFKEHPLLQISELHHKLKQPADDMSIDYNNVITQLGFWTKLKRSIGFYLYPLKNKIERKGVLKQLTKLTNELPTSMPQTISLGHKGYAQEIFLARIKNLMVRRPETIIVFGCGTGEEIFNIVKYLKPSKIVAIDYFNYRNIWDVITQKIKIEYKTDTEFIQLDYNNPSQSLLSSADLIYSHTVLEHLRDMDSIFFMLKKFLKPNGYFAAQWGPLWYSYSGDHIAAELGIEKGFEHILLTPTEYIQFYKNHPRNKKSVEAGRLTWLELGLHNFATYEEYILSMTNYFGQIKYLHWLVSPDALVYANKFHDKWNRILEVNKNISGFDLTVQCAGILLKKS